MLVQNTSKSFAQVIGALCLLLLFLYFVEDLLAGSGFLELSVDVLGELLPLRVVGDGEQTLKLVRVDFLAQSLVEIEELLSIDLAVQSVELESLEIDLI